MMAEMAIIQQILKGRKGKTFLTIEAKVAYDPSSENFDPDLQLVFQSEL